MALRKPLHISAAGWPKALDTTQDGIESYGITITGSQKIVGVGAATASGDALVYGQANASLGNLSLTSGDLAMGSNKITGLAAGTLASDAVNYQQLQNAIDGRSWKEPVTALWAMGEAAAAPGTPNDGDTYVATAGGTWGTELVSAGDIVQYTTALEWTIILAGSGGNPADGARLLNNSGGSITLGGVSIPNNQIATYSSAVWAADGAPSDGDAFLVYGNHEKFEDTQWAYNGTDWLQVGGPGYYDAGDGIEMTGNSIAVNLATNSGLQFTTGELLVDLSATGGLELNGNEIQINMNTTTGGLEINGSNELQVNLDSTGNATLSVNASNELEVDGLPTLFTVGGTAVGATVTAANLDTLTDGSNADALHTHAAGAATNVAQSLTAGENLVPGEAVYISASSTASKATSDSLDVGTKDNVIGICTSTTTTGNPATVATAGFVTLSGATMTVGARQYLAPAGGLTETRPTDVGDRVIQLGFAVTTTILAINILDFGQLF